jgi:cytoskeleton protein RodZ
MSSVGDTLRTERLRKNLSLEQIARETKINSHLLDAIETNQFDLLPRGVFAKSFVRQYARFLGLDEEEMAAEVQRAMDPGAGLPSFAVVPAQPAYKVPKVTRWEGAGARQNSSALPSLAMLVVVMLVCSGIYAWWQRSRHPTQVPVANPAVKTAGQAAALKPTVPATVTPEAVHSEEPRPQTDAATSTAPAALHASLTADEPTWVRAWADGKEVMTTMLEPNLTKTVDAVGEIRVRTGNAGALQITLNGKSVGSAGPKGQVRIVTMTPQGVQFLVPPKPVPVPEPL